MTWHNYSDESEVIDLLPDSITIETKGNPIVYPIKRDGQIVVKHLPVEVPLSYCQFKEYDGAAETLSCMGMGLRIGDAVIKPPSLGVFSLMEITNNPFPVDFSKTTTIQQFHVLYFNEYRKAAAELVRDWHCGDVVEFDPQNKDTWTPLDIAAMEYIDKLGVQGVDLTSFDVWVKILGLFSVANNGFEMVPGSGSSRFWFGAECYGTIIAGLGTELGQSLDGIIWDTPLAQLGFAYVGKARANGTKGVCRPRDRNDVRKQRILAYLRELHGELHQWQIDKPLSHCLSELQAKSKACVKRFEQLQESAKPKKVKK